MITQLLHELQKRTFVQFSIHLLKLYYGVTKFFTFNSMISTYE